MYKVQDSRVLYNNAAFPDIWEGKLIPPNIHIHDRSLSWLGTALQWTQTSPFGEMIRYIFYQHC